MVIPATYSASLFLLLLAFLCFAAWPNLYKQSQGRWRYELFSLDFALGALLFGLLTAYTLGTLGAEMSFTDRMLISGRAAFVWIVGAGAIFALGNMLLLASMSLVGVAAAFCMTFATTMIAAALLHFRAFAAATLGLGIFAMLLAIVAAALGVWGLRSSNRRANGIKAVVFAILSGIALGGVQFILKLTSDPDFGPGPYATVLMMSLGLVIATPLIDIFFMKIKIVGNPISFRNYKNGALQLHTRGLLSGALWAAGALAVLLALSVTGEQAPGTPLIFLFPAVSVILCMFFGLFRWKEFVAGMRRTRNYVFAGACCFVLGTVLLAFGLAAR